MGLATTPKILFPPFLSGQEKTMEESFSFLVTQLRPHPNPLPKGEGVTYKNLGPLFGITAWPDAAT